MNKDIVNRYRTGDNIIKYKSLDYIKGHNYIFDTNKEKWEAIDGIQLCIKSYDFAEILSKKIVSVILS